MISKDFMVAELTKVGKWRLRAARIGSAQGQVNIREERGFSAAVSEDSPFSPRPLGGEEPGGEGGDTVKLRNDTTPSRRRCIMG